jgi:hypothetical protein
VLRQFGSESFSNFLQDQEAIKRGVRLSDIQALQGQAQARGIKSSSNLKSFTRFASTALGSINLNQFTPKKGGK